MCVCFSEFVSLRSRMPFWHMLTSIHGGVYEYACALPPPHTLTYHLPSTQAAIEFKVSIYTAHLWFSGEIKMRCWQANVWITRPINLWPALWSLTPRHQMLLEPSIKVMKCNILNWHNHRAKSSLPSMHWWHIMKSNKHNPTPPCCRIYHAGNIWVPTGCSALPPGLREQHFDGQ